MYWLAYAQGPDSGNTTVTTMLACLGVAAAAAIATAVPILIARARRHRNFEMLACAAVLWGILAGGSVCLYVLAEMNWSSERTLRMDSGYFDPNDKTDAPTAPLKTWAAVAGGYAILMLWSMSPGGAAAARRTPPA